MVNSLDPATYERLAAGVTVVEASETRAPDAYGCGMYSLMLSCGHTAQQRWYPASTTQLVGMGYECARCIDESGAVSYPCLISPQHEAWEQGVACVTCHSPLGVPCSLCSLPALVDLCQGAYRCALHSDVPHTCGAGCY